MTISVPHQCAVRCKRLKIAALNDQVHILACVSGLSLSLEAQVIFVACSAFHQLRLVCQLQPFLDRAHLATVIQALVTSRLDDCSVLYLGDCSENDLLKIQELGY